MTELSEGCDVGWYYTEHRDGRAFAFLSTTCETFGLLTAPRSEYLDGLLLHLLSPSKAPLKKARSLSARRWLQHFV